MDEISGLRKTYFFPLLKACERRNFDFCVFLRMCSLTKYLQIVFSRWNITLHIRKNTQKSQFLLSQAFKWKKIMCFDIPRCHLKLLLWFKKNFLITLMIEIITNWNYSLTEMTEITDWLASWNYWNYWLTNGFALVTRAVTCKLPRAPYRLHFSIPKWNYVFCL